jgi:hypothetical protein
MKIKITRKNVDVAGTISFPAGTTTRDLEKSAV